MAQATMGAKLRLGNLLHTVSDLVLNLQVLESSLAGGGLVADAQCHELYGNPESAPDLRSSVAGSGDGPSELSKLADCMSTPFTGDDKNLGELVRAEARAQALRSQLQVSERYNTSLACRPEQ